MIDFLKIKSGVLFIALSCLLITRSNAQQLHVGDLLPDISVGKILNAASQNMRTADFKDRLLIIDLWATNCGSCITAMPKLDSLQKQFGNSIKILPVTQEPESQLKAFWERNRNTKGLSINTVVEDWAFVSYFPHRYISHEVWVYKGKVIAITGMEQITVANIKKVLNGEQVKLPLKDDFGTTKFNGAVKSLKEHGTEGSNSTGLIKYAIVKRFKENLTPSSVVNADAGGIVRDSSTRSLRAYIINEGLYNCYLWALLNAKGMEWMQMVKTIYGDFEPNRVVWDVADRSKYLYEPTSGDYEEWRRKNAICFESLRPDTGQTDQKVYTTIVQDLNDILGLEVRFEKRKIKTLLLTKTGTEDRLKTKNAGIDESYHTAKEGSSFKMRDTELAAFVKAFNEHNQNPYIIDESKYTSNVDMDLIITVWTDVNAIKKELQKYGLSLKEEDREIEMLVFTETGGGFKIKDNKK